MTPCILCNPDGNRQTGGFTTGADFRAEHARISALIEMGRVQPFKSDGLDLEFRCPKCGQHWHLSAPDQAYRGFLKATSPTAQRIAAIKAKRGEGDG